VADRQGRDFFISYTQVTRSWAEWIAVQLEQAGYSTVLRLELSARQALHPRDAAGHHHGGADDRGVVAGLLRVEVRGGRVAGAFAKDHTGEQRLLVPVRLQECEPPGLLASRGRRSFLHS
jgi:hypothetical protein